jgi:hypothetical protein
MLVNGSGRSGGSVVRFGWMWRVGWTLTWTVEEERGDRIGLQLLFLERN